MFLVDTNVFLEILLKQDKREDCKKFLNAYQYSIAKYHGLKVVTMDRDFERIKDMDILFL
jgi:predicted nucleic acid-binding protein